LTYSVARERGETSEEAYQRQAKKLEKLMQKRKDILEFEPLAKFKKIKVVYKGLFHKGDECRITPIYYFVFNEYDPVSHWVDKFDSISSKEIFSDVYRKLHANVLNDFINEEQKIRAIVHYNFLSSFTHLTRKSIDRLRKIVNSYSIYDRANRARHIFIELNLLYAISILRYLLLFYIKFFSNTEHKIIGKDELVTFSEEIGKKYDYFWFIFNNYDEYDLWRYKTSKEYHRRVKGKTLDQKVPYYRDPYDRLERQHQNFHELSTGRIYTSRWPI
jgi:hypothetical protein